MKDWLETKILPSLVIAIIFGLLTMYNQVNELRHDMISIQSLANISISDSKVVNKQQNKDIMLVRERIIILEERVNYER